ncbi:hypothetical protein PtA15_9A662 [Puccinia triticina]|uniref:E3 ubiquitin-protein ligase PEP5 n=1 Tax=Puccinia triticina TaxID=208348 RepID=A0ABY7CXM2_9BASI|nr:uncharacterized protein PtA15_9A662 [Puccinia triticina]WAQ88535.1 hypothetical protein PtA15_9A662 [Puccinia triticina]WAR60714.1 hypothetical protein PtB15_9B653 [Puccinia triticina]
MAIRKDTKPSPTTWRQFTFFNSYPLHSSSDLANPPELLSQPHSIAAIEAGFGSTILAHLDGRISLLDPSLDLLRSWPAFPGGRTLLVRPTSIQGVLISIGEEAGNSVPILKIWNLRHEDKQSSAPQLLGFSKIQNGNRPHPVTTLALSLNLSYLAVGLADGTVLLYRNLDQALVSAASATHISRPPPVLPKPKIIYTSPEPITGLAFRSPKPSASQSYFSNPDLSEPAPKPSSTHRHTCLFIVTTAKVLCFFTSGRGAGSGAEPIVMDDLGGSIGCSEMMDNGDLILADDSALYVYGPEGRGACLAYEGPKARLNSRGNYLVITSPPSSTGLKNDVEQTRVIVFDLQNRFIAYNALFRGTVLHVWAEWGELYVLTSAAEVTRLVERPLSEKLSILYDKDMYVLATNVAKSSGADPSELSEIYRRFGDYLYQKSDFEGAVQQYINTIGTVQPSIVVRKFLDAQRISNLTSYLQELHARGVANADHTTLLLNCYTKLKDHAKLDDFIKANERASRDSGDPLPFDLETAIRVCRQAGYFEPALYLAKQYRQDEEYLRIQVEDRGKWLDAVQFMRSLGHVGTRAEEKDETAAPDSIIGPSDEEDREAVWGTLLELYLQTSAEAGDGRARMRSRAMSLLKKGAEGSKLRYEPTQALIVCLTHDFVPGIVLLYDRLGMVEDILRFWIDRADSVESLEAQEAQSRIFECLEKYGDAHPELYPIVLRYLATSPPQLLSSPNGQLNGLQKALDHIEKRKILSPIEVIEILSKPGSSASIGTVKTYLLNQVTNQKHQMNSDLDLINSYRKEVDKKRTELHELVEKPKIFNLNNKCASCFTPLDLPVVHFMCQHSYHQRCLGDQEACVKCLSGSGDQGVGDEERKPASRATGEPDQAMKEMMALIRRNKTFIDPDHSQSQPQLKGAQLQQQLESRIDEHRFFVDEVREADDPFGYIASSFSKGML